MQIILLVTVKVTVTVILSGARCNARVAEVRKLCARTEEHSDEGIWFQFDLSFFTIYNNRSNYPNLDSWSLLVYSSFL